MNRVSPEEIHPGIVVNNPLTAVREDLEDVVGGFGPDERPEVLWPLRGLRLPVLV